MLFTSYTLEFAMTPISNLLTDRFESALLYACQLHANQLRKDGTTPYIAHLLSVSALVLENGGDEDEAIAALLHDAVEDQGGASTGEAIRKQFGDRVFAIVDGCTEPLEKSYNWRQRKQAYLDHLQHAIPEVCRVSLADKLHNLRSLLVSLQHEGEQVWQRFNSDKANHLWFYYSLSAIYQVRSQDPMVHTFTQLVQQLVQHLEQS
jgi:(p)ppGpp synthase/HD superfamily hydrolase